MVLKSDGAVLTVEPTPGERVEENLNPFGRLFSGASIFVCMPNSLAGGGKALGTVAPESALRDVFVTAGFGSFRRAAETPFNPKFPLISAGISV